MKSITLFISIILFILFLSEKADAQNITQTIRGTIVDYDTKATLIGAYVVILNGEEMLGTSTDIDGNFKIENAPIGRTALKISYIGYEEKIIPNLLVESGKETVLNIELIESVNQLADVVVKAKKNKGEVLNEMAVLSARSLTVEQTQRYAGSIDDPARMVSSFAGVTGDAEGNNDIVVRGNSPKGILWRLEGVEIINPNHFASEGATGGPINALNSAMLGNSDFYTGAFEPEYGNALSGVFDMKLRNGNNEKREYSATLSILGTDVTAEGPFSKNYRGSYLANYRYSTLSILDNLGVVDFGGVPRYQDASFKVMLPVNKKHIISVFGLGGLSGISQEETDPENEEIITGKYSDNTQFGVAGLTHSFQLNDDAYLKNTFSVSARQTSSVYDQNDGSGFYRAYNEDFTKSYFRFAGTYHHKLNAKNKFKAGLVLTRQVFDLESKYKETMSESFTPLLNQSGNADLMQGFISWKHRFNEKLTAVTGLHYMNFLYNKNQSIEPRAAIKYRLRSNQSISAGMGIHSRTESISTYLAEVENSTGYYRPNENLDLAKAAHFVFGYNNFLNKSLQLKAEVYYQKLYDVPVDADSESNFSLLNLTDYYTTRTLENEGTGTNYGVEVTVEKFLTKGFYYLSTVSLYRSLYAMQDGEEHSSTFDGNYVANLLAGKEFKLRKGRKNRTYFINTKVALIGARKITPIDLQASIEAGETVRDIENPFSSKGEDIFKADLAIGVRRNWKNVTSEIKIDVQNVTNNAGYVSDYYNDETQSVVVNTQLGLLPVLSYKVKF